ncbi:DNA-directed RNA polymerase subunit beta [Macrococcoides caseolyticum]|uniref:DNA-directed RNA polymerase subunit beta n=1 Tax=Macrococcoides caseolyticum TaxID=69966 RepID=UPI001F40D0D8|nr:DNA-directed RNA polymerase subunit beta [Macrococcus caseolyticus]MCE4957602.1 DNA-directed RNA polymerase subunit beta [Macrococcus caseolyticus]
MRKIKLENKTSVINGTEVIHRRIPILLSVVVVFILMLLLFIIGMMIGYGILHSPFDIFKPSTWTHLIKLTGGEA